MLLQEVRAAGERNHNTKKPSVFFNPLNKTCIEQRMWKGGEGKSFVSGKARGSAKRYILQAPEHAVQSDMFPSPLEPFLVAKARWRHSDQCMEFHIDRRDVIWTISWTGFPAFRYETRILPCYFPRNKPISTPNLLMKEGSPLMTFAVSGQQQCNDIVAVA